MFLITTAVGMNSDTGTFLLSLWPSLKLLIGILTELYVLLLILQTKANPSSFLVQKNRETQKAGKIAVYISRLKRLSLTDNNN